MNFSVYIAAMQCQSMRHYLRNPGSVMKMEIAADYRSCANKGRTGKILIVICVKMNKLHKWWNSMSLKTCIGKVAQGI